ncbi:MAG: hypothetical protein V6Z81_01800, partial [Parvularculales bacterium]
MKAFLPATLWMIRLILAGGFLIAGLGVLSSFVGVAVLFHPESRAVLTELVGDRLQRSRSTGLTIDHISGLWPIGLHLEGVHLSDHDGMWFSIGSINLSWQPAALMERTFHITNLQAQDVVLHRVPDLLPENIRSIESIPVEVMLSNIAIANSMASLFLSPVNVRIDNMEASSMQINSVIKEVPARVMVQGEAYLSSDVIEFSLTASRRDGEQGELDLYSVVKPATREGEVVLTLVDGHREGEGVVAGLVGIPAIGPMAADVRISSTVETLEVDGKITAGRMGSFTLMGKGNWAENLSLEVAGHGQIGPFLHPHLTFLDSNRFTLALSGVLEGGHLNASNIMFELGSINVEGNGEIHYLASGRLPFQVSGSVAGLSSLRSSRSSLLPSPERTVLDGLSGEKPSKGLWSNVLGKLAHRFDVDVLEVNAEGELNSVREELTLFKVTAQSGSAIKASFEDISGSVDSGWQARFFGGMDGHMLTSPLLRQIAGASLEFGGAVSLASDGSVTMEGVTITSKETDFALDGSFSTQAVREGGSGAVKADFTMSLADVAVLDSSLLSGALSIKGRIEGVAPNYFVDVTGYLEDGSFNNHTIRFMEAALSLQGDTPGQGSLVIDGGVGRTMVTMHPRLQNDATQLVLEKIEGHVFDIPVSGILRIPLEEDAVVTGHIEGQDGALDTLAEIVGMSVGGTVDYTLSLQEQQGQRAALTVKSDVITSSFGGILLEEVQLIASLLPLGEAFSGQIEAQLKATGGSIAGLGLEAATVSIKGVSDNFNFAADMQGVAGIPSGQAFASRFSGRVIRPKQEEVDVRIFVDDTLITLNDITVAQNKGLSMNLKEGSFDIEGLALQTDKGGKYGSLAGKVRLSGEHLMGDIKLNHIPLELTAFLPMPYYPTGFVSGAGVVDTFQEVGQFSFEVSGIHVLEHFSGAALPLVAGGYVKGGWQQDVLWLNGRFDNALSDGTQGTPLMFHMTVPVDRTPASPVPILVEEGVVGGALTWQGPAHILSVFLEQEGQRFIGNVSVDLALSGTVDAPALQGMMALEGGVFDYIEGGVFLDNIHFEAQGEDGRSLTFVLSAEDGLG